MRLLFLLLCLGFGFALQAQTPSQPAPSVDEAWFGENQGLPLLEAMKRPQIGPQSHKLKDWKWQQGNATYSLSGQATPLTVQNQTIGFYFRGEGRIRYISHEPKEFATLKVILKHDTYAKSQESVDAITFEAPVEEAIFWFAGMSVPELPGEALSSDPKACLKRISNFLDIDQAPFLHELALRSLKSTTQPYFRAQLLCWGYAWLHVVDPLDSESLQFSSVSRQRGNTWTLCSQQPMGWTYAQPKSPRFALTHLDAQVEASRTPKGRAVFTQTFLPKVDGLTAIDLRLRNTQPGLSTVITQYTQRTRVRRVTDEQGNPLPFDHANEGLLIQIPGLKANVPVTIRIEVEGELLDYVDSGSKYLGWRLKGAWFPLPKDPAAEVYTVHATVKTPQETTPILGGQSLRREVKDGWRIVETRLDHPVRNFGILGFALPCQEETREGITIRTIGWGQVSLDRQLLDKAWSVLGGLEQMFGGTLPFKEFNLIVNTLEYNDLPGILSVQRTSHGYSTQQIARGFAQQYWGQVTKPWNHTDDWVRYALSEFSAGLLIRLTGETQGQATYQRMANNWFQELETSKGMGSLAMAYRVNPGLFTTARNYQNREMMKTRGACLFYQLHQKLGDEKTTQLLVEVLNQSSYQPMASIEFSRLLKILGSSEIQALFERGLWDGVPPEATLREAP